MKPRTRLFASLAAGATALVIAAVLYGIYGLDASGSPPAVLDRLRPTAGEPQVADIHFADAEGHEVKLSDYRGRYVLINLWATWCGPCITELPAIEHLTAEVPKDRIAVLPVDMEKLDASKVKDFLKMHGLEGLPIYIDKDYSAMKGFVANELPLTVLIDDRGREIARAAGAQKWDDPASVAYLTKISAGKAN